MNSVNYHQIGAKPWGGGGGLFPGIYGGGVHANKKIS